MKSSRANPRIGYYSHFNLVLEIHFKNFNRFIVDSLNGSTSYDPVILLKSVDLSYEFISINGSSELEGLVQTENKEIEAGS